MRLRCLVAVGAFVIGFAWLAPAPVAAQAPSAPEQPTYNPPRTPDGRPDLSGVWSHNSATPLERPKELEGRALLTDQEVATLKQRAAELFGDDAGDAAFGNVFTAALNNKKYVASDGVGNYNQFWLVDREFDNRTSLITDPPDGRLPALTAEAAKRQGAAAEYRRLHPADGPEDVPHNCHGGSLPMIGAGYNSYYQIAQTRDIVAINMEMMHDIRIIPMDGRPMPPKSLTSLLGYSRGRWDGDTLVVETSNFKDRRRLGPRSTTSTTRLTERFTRMDAATLKYEVTFDDPETYTRPWTAVLYWKFEPKDKIYEFACHEGNEAMPGTLSGYRAQERAAAEAARKGSR